MNRRARITIVGAGATGATAAHWMAQAQLGDIVLQDIVEGLPQGKALDLLQSGPIAGFSNRVVGANDFEATSGSDLLIVTAGVARKPGMSRDDLLQTNLNIVRSVTEELVRRSPDAILIVLTNPVDVMTYVAWKVSGWPRERVMGQSGILDSARFRAFIAQAVGVSMEDVTALVLGGHGDAMVPLVRYAYVGGIPIDRFLDRPSIDALVDRTRKGGGEIVSLLKTGSAFYAPGAALAQMADAILRDKKRVLPVAAVLAGEYGEDDVVMGVPVVLGAGGVERIIELELEPEEREAFARSVRSVREPIASVRHLL